MTPFRYENGRLCAEGVGLDKIGAEVGTPAYVYAGGAIETAYRNLEQALTGLPLTAILNRPDGVEYNRTVRSDDMSGGHVFALPLGSDVPHGTWRLEMKSDLEVPALDPNVC